MIKLPSITIMILFLFGTFANIDAISQSESELSNTVTECEKLSEQYSILGETGFRKLHNYNDLSRKCSMLYNDPIWSYSGEDRTQVLGDRLFEIIKNEEQTMANLEHSTFVESIASIPTENDDEYQYFFEICGKENYLEISSISVHSDIQSVELDLDYILSPGACKSFDVMIHAKNPLSISVAAFEVEEIQGVEELREQIQSLKEELQKKIDVIKEQIKVMVELLKIDMSFKE